MSYFDISLDLANSFYSWGWRASMFGALITFFESPFCFGEPVSATAILNIQWGYCISKRAHLKKKRLMLD